MAYATVQDVKARTLQTFTADEESVIAVLLDDAAVMIDAYRAAAPADAKKTVSCRMVQRVIADAGEIFPTGASQGSMTAGSYSQSFTMGSGGGTGELYLSKQDHTTLGGGDQIGSYSPTQALVGTPLIPLCLGEGHYD